jgi:colanic acid/amylovoran biosynthesis glycosyltransferase
MSRPGARERECLVLFTNYFPFYRGEEYLETELPHLVRRFGKIILVPVMYERTMEQTRPLPPDVVLITIHMPSSRRARLGHVVANAGKAYRTGLMRYASPPWRPLRFAFDWYFTTRGYEFWRRSRTAILAAIGDSDDVVIYSYWLFVTALEAVLLCRELGDGRVHRAVSRAHRYDVMKDSNAIRFLPQRRLLVSSLDAVYPVSEAGVSNLLDDVPDLAERIRVRRLGVGAPQGMGQRRNRPRLDLVSCSSLKPVKRVDLIVDALAIAAARGIDLHWTHFGGAGQELDLLRKRSSRLLPDGSFDLKGHVSNQAVLDHYLHSSATVFLNASISEGVPVSIMEAMANWVPALATRAGGTTDLVTEGHDGWIIPVDTDAARMADSLEAIWDLSPEDYQGFSANAHLTWSLAWDADRLYDSFAHELSEVTGS